MRTMATLTTTKKKQKEESVARKGALARYGEFPFFLSRLRDEFDRLLDRFSQRWPRFGEENGWRWGLEVGDQENTVVVRAEAPGFEAGDLDLQVSGNRLIIRAAKKVETKGKEGKTEYREQECYESVTLPSGIDKDKVEAKYHNGVLTVTLPKTAEGRGKRITVKST
jgi:HSP20 family protein